MRHDRGMKKSKKAPEDTAAIELADDVIAEPGEAKAKKGGIVRSLFRLVTLPFRLAAGVARLLVTVIGVVVATLLLPIRAAGAVIRRIVTLASDITFALWRLVMKLVGLVLGLVKLVFSILNATIGGAIRLVFRIIKRSFKLILGAFLLGNRVGKRSAKTAAKAADPLDLAA